MNFVADLALALVAIVAALLLLWLIRFWVKHAKDDPTVWEGELRRLDKLDRALPPPSDAILFVGSSSFRYWKTLVADMAPLKVLDRGFGGSQIHDSTFHVRRLVVPFKPRAIVFYGGENDIAGILWSPRKTAAQARDAFKKFCLAVHAELPLVHIYVIAIKPPKRRIAHWPALQEANRLLREFCATDERLHYIDVVTPMLDEAGNPRVEVYRWDGLHYNERGYAEWTSIIKPILQKAYP
ncbi:MAG TPA: GDSL-type esterase/lipase family protein [Steroidobacteraceae bacterium]|nr:GDSL-type esterase/lipase family protein [Steroidobacteraceae bacterium]